MKIYATFMQEVDINPKDVIQKLIDNEIGKQCWTFEREGKYYRGFEGFEKEIEIPKEKYDYINNLTKALKYLIEKGNHQ